MLYIKKFNESNYDPYKSYAAGILPFCKNTKRFLVGLRSYEVREPHTWGPFGGKVDDDDDYIDESIIEETAIRELEEETGYDSSFTLIKGYVYKYKNFEYHNYIGILESEFEPMLNWEHDDYKWLTYDELINLENKHIGLTLFLNKSKDVFSRLLNISIYENVDNKNYMQFYHGGNLDFGLSEDTTNRKDKYEYGPGLYATEHMDTARKYAKGSRKLYKIEVEEGNDIFNSLIDINDCIEFINKFAIASLRKRLINDINKYNIDGNVKAYIFNNILLNNKAIKPSNTNEWRKFYVDKNIDYEMTDRTFGFNDKMIVIYNLKKVKKISRI